ncbi:MAG: ribokinase [Leptolinea sp.]
MKSRQPTITVIGSFMMDLVIKAERRPLRGETLIGQSFGIYPGGKGFNQAVAASRLGAQVHMVGKLGDDDFGKQFRKSLDFAGIGSEFVFTTDQAMTGVGSPVIDAQGDNSIIVVPGANMLLTPADVEKARSLITRSDMVLMQLENPIDTVLFAAGIAKSAGVPVLLNPAPARPLPDELLSLITILTPNETEAEMLTGCNVADTVSALQAARILLGKNIHSVVLTLGDRGALLAEKNRSIQIPGFHVDVVDTTAAGDAFCAALAVKYSSGYSMDEAIAFANSVGALATTILGAEPAMPLLEDVKQFNKNHRSPQLIEIALP